MRGCVWRSPRDLVFAVRKEELGRISDGPGVGCGCSEPWQLVCDTHSCADADQGGYGLRQLCFCSAVTASRFCCRSPLRADYAPRRALFCWIIPSTPSSVMPWLVHAARRSLTPGRVRRASSAY